MTSKNTNNAPDLELDSDKHLSRRRWLKIGTMAAPGALLLASRPAMAANCGISGFMSAQVGTSVSSYNPSSCGAWSPGAWYNAGGMIGSSTTRDAWDIAGEDFDVSTLPSVFTTGNLSMTSLVKLTNGISDGAQTFTTDLTYYLKDVLVGPRHFLPSGSKSIVQHAVAAYLNASFIANGGGGSSPPSWMANYPVPSDIIALFLLWEISELNTPPTGVTYQVQRGGVVLADSTMLTASDYDTHFKALSEDGAL